MGNYELLCDDDQDTAKAAEEIDKILERAAKELARVSMKYPDSGLGDTATDEAVCSHLYSILHWETN